MPYASVSDIQCEFKNLSVTATSTPTLACVTEFLTQADAFINMNVGCRYTLPITDTDSLEILKKIEIDLVSYRIAKILDLTKSNPIPDKNIPQDLSRGGCYKMAVQLLKDICQGRVDLPGETPTDSSGGLSSFHTQPKNLDIIPNFNITEQQW